MIIGPDMIGRAIELARPSANAILAAKGTTWGPMYVQGYVFVPGLEDDPVPFTLGDQEASKRGRQFFEIAREKLEVCRRVGFDSGLVVNQMPWLLNPGEYLYPGGVNFYGICVAASGAEGSADEAISFVIAACLAMLAKLDVELRKAEDRDKI